MARSAAVFLTNNNDLENIDLAMQLMMHADARAKHEPPLVLGVLISHEDMARELDATLDSVARARNVRYHRLCPDRDGLREDLRTLAPVYLKADKAARSHVLLIGLDGQWEQVLMQLIISTQDHPETPPLISVVASANEQTALAAWRAERPDLPLVLEFKFLDRGTGLLPPEANVAAWRTETPPPQVVVVLRPDNDSITTVLALRRPGNIFGLTTQPLLVRRTQEDKLLGQITGPGPRATPFGGLIRASMIERALDRKGDDLAIAIHSHYLDKAATLGAGSPASLAAWDGLPENLRDANRAAAEHAPILFAAAGLTSDDLAEINKPGGAIDALKLETLAKVEHCRWIADRIDRGWRSGAARDNDRRLHPSIRRFEDVSEQDREKDRNAVRVLLRLAVA